MYYLQYKVVEINIQFIKNKAYYLNLRNYFRGESCNTTDRIYVLAKHTDLIRHLFQMYSVFNNINDFYCIFSTGFLRANFYFIFKLLCIFVHKNPWGSYRKDWLAVLVQSFHKTRSASFIKAVEKTTYNMTFITWSYNDDSHAICKKCYELDAVYKPEFYWHCVIWDSEMSFEDKSFLMTCLVTQSLISFLFLYIINSAPSDTCQLRTNLTQTVL